MTTDQLAYFVAQAEAKQLDAHVIAILIAANTGLRRGEVLALVWDDVDFGKGSINVRHSLTADDMTLKGPKTASGNREVFIDAHFVETLRRWANIQDKELTQLGLKPTGETPVVSSEVGGFMHPENLSRWWRKHRGEFGLDGFGLHQFRHTYVSVLIGSGADPTSAQSLAGHKSPEITMGLYAHANQANMKHAANLFGAALYGHRNRDASNNDGESTTNQEAVNPTDDDPDMVA